MLKKFIWLLLALPLTSKAPPMLLLKWDYDPVAAQTVSFEVWHSPVPGNPFVFFANAGSATNFLLAPDQPADFFICRAVSHDGVASDWNR